MKKNVVWWPAVVNTEHTDKYGGYEYFNTQEKLGNIGVKEMIVYLYRLQNQSKKIYLGIE